MPEAARTRPQDAIRHSRPVSTPTHTNTHTSTHTHNMASPSPDKRTPRWVWDSSFRPIRLRPGAGRSEASGRADRDEVGRKNGRKTYQLNAFYRPIVNADACICQSLRLSQSVPVLACLSVCLSVCRSVVMSTCRAA
ncbi:unnamed protein product [Protopolystoma xenopodis]|uniref:Uncharacterized protein n=1 Tax=Protopolystoma xenopodis TaxID=117903 RepID=A0A3S5CL01_9PLAT|nr:unnamed protein product [Protopolystoma xenopodis]